MLINTVCGLFVVSLGIGLSVIPRRLKQFGYICCDTTVSVLIVFSGCVLFRMLCLPKQFVHHLLPPLQKCNNLGGHGHVGHPYKLPDLWLPNSPDLNPIDYKIWVIIQQRAQCRTWRIWCSVWLMHGLEWKTALLKMSLTIGAGISIPAFSHRRMLWIFTVTKNSMIIKIKLKFIAETFLSDCFWKFFQIVSDSFLTYTFHKVV